MFPLIWEDEATVTVQPAYSLFSGLLSLCRVDIFGLGSTHGRVYGWQFCATSVLVRRSLDLQTIILDVTCQPATWIQFNTENKRFGGSSFGMPCTGKSVSAHFPILVIPPLHMGLSKNGVYIIILYCIYPNHGHFMGNMTHDDSPSKIGCILFSDKPP